MNNPPKIKAAASYAGVSQRTMRTRLKEGLKQSRLPSGMILIKYQWIDEYLESFQVSGNRVDEIVDEIMSKMNNTDIINPWMTTRL